MQVGGTRSTKDKEQEASLHTSDLSLHGPILQDAGVGMRHAGEETSAEATSSLILINRWPDMDMAVVMVEEEGTLPGEVTQPAEVAIALFLEYGL